MRFRTGEIKKVEVVIALERPTSGRDASRRPLVSVLTLSSRFMRSP
jgi:hypothetical protein